MVVVRRQRRRIVYEPLPVLVQKHNLTGYLKSN
jgi:hypothetical protein